MTATKEKTVLDFINNTYNEYNVDPRENLITVSFDFVIDTGTGKIIMKIGRKRWDESNARSIVNYLKSKEQQIRNALLTHQDAILLMK